MAFLEIRFPEDISLHAMGGPRFLTDRVAINSGQEYHNSIWSEALWEFEINNSAKIDSYFATLRAFFLVVLGSGKGFRFKDWTDYTASISEGKFVAVTGGYQAVKRYTFSGQTYDRTIRKLVAGTFSSTGGVGSIAGNTGLWTGTGTPSTWSGEFDVPVWFKDDNQPAEVFDRSGGQFVWRWDSIGLIEIRNPA